jgi:hypothetical protein
MGPRKRVAEAGSARRIAGAAPDANDEDSSEVDPRRAQR